MGGARKQPKFDGAGRQLEDAEVERALREGWTWSQVAEALGVTRLERKTERSLAGVERIGLAHRAERLLH